MQTHPEYIFLSCTKDLRIGAAGSGLLTECSLVYVKVKKGNPAPTSSALVKVQDGLGTVFLLFKGAQIASLFDISTSNWIKMESQVKIEGELFYRHFKNGLNDSFSVAQKEFYKFCEKNLTTHPVYVSFMRVPNMRKEERAIPFLNVLECKKATPRIIDYYYNKMQNHVKAKQI